MRNRIKQARTAKGLTQKQLGREVGVSHVRVSMWERGREIPSPAQMQDIAITLGTSISSIFPDYVGKEPPSPGRLEISTLAGLRKSAEVQVGQKMLRRISLHGEGDAWRPATVVQTYPRFFRICMDKSGYSECINYQAFLCGEGIRRMST